MAMTNPAITRGQKFTSEELPGKVFTAHHVGSWRGNPNVTDAPRVPFISAYTDSGSVLSYFKPELCKPVS
jgi:hypothetical protein